MVVWRHRVKRQKGNSAYQQLEPTKPVSSHELDNTQVPKQRDFGQPQFSRTKQKVLVSVFTCLVKTLHSNPKGQNVKSTSQLPQISHELKFHVTTFQTDIMLHEFKFHVTKQTCTVVPFALLQSNFCQTNSSKFQNELFKQILIPKYHLQYHTKISSQCSWHPKKHTKTNFGEADGVDWCQLSQSHHFAKIDFFGLDAAWLNESRCPGGRPSVSYNKYWS